jgi:hypothetical protein
MTQLREKFFTIFCLNLVYLRRVRLIKMYLNETYNKVCISKLLSDKFPIQNGLKQRRYSNAIGFQFFFRIYPQESPRKSSQFGIEWDPSTTGLC